MSSRRGNKRENDVADMLRDQGWFAMCGRASLGPADVTALKAGEQPRLIQVKSDRRSPWKHFGPEERAGLIAAASLAGAVAELCWWPPYGKPSFLPSPLWPKVRAEVPA